MKKNFPFNEKNDKRRNKGAKVYSIVYTWDSVKISRFLTVNRRIRPQIRQLELKNILRSYSPTKDASIRMVFDFHENL